MHGGGWGMSHMEGMGKGFLAWSQEGFSLGTSVGHFSIVMRINTLLCHNIGMSCIGFPLVLRLFALGR